MRSLSSAAGRLKRLPFALGRTLTESRAGRSAIRAAHATPLREDRVLILRLDEIGDYVLFRNFLKPLRESPRFENRRITLVGNSVWSELAERVDSELVDSFVWIDKNSFQSSLTYRYRTLTRLLRLGAATIVQPRFSREAALEDAIVTFLPASRKIGNRGDTHNITAARKAITDRAYTELLRADEALAFEFEKNRSFFEALLRTDLRGVELGLPRSALGESASRWQPYIVLFPGAGEPRRRWAAANFAATLDFVLSATELNVIVCGSPADRGLADEIVRDKDRTRVFDLAGKTSVFDLATLIADARLLISNETGAVHIAAATRTPAVCLSNGNHFGRFTEYPSRISTWVTTIYPTAIERERGRFEALHRKYFFGSFEDIDEITPARVIEAVATLTESRPPSDLDRESGSGLS